MKMKRLGILALMMTAMLTVTALTLPTYYNIMRIGPFFTNVSAFDSATGAGVGGYVRIYLSGDTELVGNVVFISANNTVKHSAVLANYNSLAGVVVGGSYTSAGQAANDSANVGDTASFIGGRVFVLVKGRAWATMDTGAGLSPGTGITVSVKAGSAGRFTGRAAAIDTFYRVFGTVVDSAVAGRRTLININR